MASSTDKSILEQIADVLRAHDVKFIVIGGQAEALLGSPRVTYDVDLCDQRSAQNLDNLENVNGRLVKAGEKQLPEERKINVCSALPLVVFNPVKGDPGGA
jgi:hypothetical protein